MSLIDVQSYDLNNTAALSSIFDNDFSHGGGYTIGAAPTEYPAHAQVLHVAAASSIWAYRNIPGTPTTVVIGTSFSLKALSTSTGHTNILEVDNQAGAVAIEGYVLHNGGVAAGVTLAYTISGTPHIVATSAAIPSLNTRHYLLIEATLSLTGVVTAWLDGVLIGSTGSIDTTGIGTSFGSWGPGVMELGSGTGIVLDVSDFLLMSDTGDVVALTSALDDVQVWGLFPTADSVVAWTPSTGMSNYALVNSVPPGADYVSTAATATQDLYTITTFPTVRAIVGTKADYWAEWVTGASTFKAAYHISGTTYLGADLSPANAFAYVSELLALSPATGAAWTDAEIAALTFGQKSDSVPGGDSLRVSQSAIEVAHYLIAPLTLTGTGLASSFAPGDGVVAGLIIITGTALASSFAAGAGAVTASAIVRGAGLPSSFQAGYGAVKTGAIPMTPGLVIPYWSGLDYTASAQTLTFTAPPNPTQTILAYYSLPAVDPVHSHFEESKSSWLPGEDTWELSLPYLAGTLRVYTVTNRVIEGAGLPSSFAAGPGTVTANQGGDLWVLYSDDPVDNVNLAARLMYLNDDGAFKSWAIAPVTGPWSAVGSETFTVGKAHPLTGVWYVASRSAYLRVYAIDPAAGVAHVIWQMDVTNNSQVFTDMYATLSGVVWWTMMGVDVQGVWRYDPDTMTARKTGMGRNVLNHPRWGDILDAIWVDEYDGTVFTMHDNEFDNTSPPDGPVYQGVASFSTDDGFTWTDAPSSFKNDFRGEGNDSLSASPMRGNVSATIVGNATNGASGQQPITGAAGTFLYEPNMTLDLAGNSASGTWPYNPPHVAGTYRWMLDRNHPGGNFYFTASVGVGWSQVSTPGQLYDNKTYSVSNTQAWLVLVINHGGGTNASVAITLDYGSHFTNIDIGGKSARLASFMNGD